MVTDMIIKYTKCKAWGVAEDSTPGTGDAALTGDTECENVTPMDTEVVLVVRGTLGGMHYYFAQDPIKIIWRSPCLDN